MSEPAMTATLTALRKLAEPGQAGLLRAECDDFGRQVARLSAANEEHWLRLSEAHGRIEAAQLAARTG